MAGELRATVFAAVKGADNLKKAIGDIKGLEDQLGKLGTAGKAIGGIMKGVGAAVGAIGAAGFAFGGQAVGEAKQLEQNMLGLKTVFGDLTPQMEKFSENAYNIGLSQSEAGKASTFLGSVLKQSGFDMDTVAGQTQNLVGLATDLAATYGYDVQDALLGMTALFRGEYDPIEKFGVAMKQNEINAELAARGQDKLTGAARRNAEQQIRLELLLERSTDAQGAMARGAGNLFVEQAKLEAQFKNMQATIGQELTPVLAQLAEQMGPVLTKIMPILVEAFRAAGEIIIFLGNTISDLFNPTTELGDKFSTLTESFNILFESVFGRDFDLAAIFDGATWALGVFMDVLSGLVRLVFAVTTEFQALGIMIKAALSGDWDTVKKGISGIKDELYDAADAALAARKAMSVDEQNQKDWSANMKRQADQYLAFLNGRAKEAKQAGTVLGNELGDGLGEGVKDSVKDFWSGLYDEIAKQNAKNKLEMLGASEGLINAVLGSGADWEKVFSDVVKGGIASVTSAQQIFNKTAAGIEEVKAAADKFADQQLSWLIYQSNAYERQLARYKPIIDANNKLIAQQKELTAAFIETRDEIFATYAESSRSQQQLGQYTSAVQELSASLYDLIDANPYTGSTGLFSSTATANLKKSTDGILSIMSSIAQQRDDLSTRLGSAKSLVESISDSIFGSFNITSVTGKAQDIIKVFKETVEQTRLFSSQLRSLQSAGLNQTAIDQIISAGASAGSQTAQALIEGGPKAIREVNKLFSQLGDVSNTIGEDVAKSMYGEGIDITNGLIEGMLSQQSALEMAAESLANSFNNAFADASSSAALSLVGPSISQLIDRTTPYGTRGVTPTSRGSGTYNITVNAGMGTNGQSVGQIIIDEIKKFERQSGKVFASV